MSSPEEHPQNTDRPTTSYSLKHMSLGHALQVLSLLPLEEQARALFEYDILDDLRSDPRVTALARSLLRRAPENPGIALSKLKAVVDIYDQVDEINSKSYRPQEERILGPSHTELFGKPCRDLWVH